MDRTFWMKKVLPHVWAVLIFMVLSVGYFAPAVFQGKSMGQGDVHSVSGIQKENRECYEKTGSYSDWSNRLFGGMPNTGTEGMNLYEKVGPVVMGGLPTLHAGILFFYMIGFYILLCVLGCRSWLSALGAIAYAFSTYNILIIDAGHANKCWAMACMAPIVAGVILCFKGRYVWGALITLVFTGLHIMYAHQQITYYLLMILLIVVIAYAVDAFRKKQMKTYLKGGVVAVAVALISLWPSLGAWWVTYDYSKDTMRGGSVLQQTPDGKPESTGLERDYAFQWSYGKMESFTLLIPGFYGGSSNYRLGEQSELYQLLRPSGQTAFAQNAPMYWGHQPFTAGPVYVGAIICFLFLLGLFVVKGPEKWWLLAVTVLSLLLSWGHNLPGFNNFLFDHLPLYNRFRTPSMALVMAELSMAVLAMLALKSLFDNEKEKARYAKDLLYAAGITGGICLFFTLFGKNIFDFSGASDIAYRLPDWIMQAVREDRAGLLTGTAFRSFLFILLAAGLLWLYLKRNFKPGWTLGLIVLLVVVDLWQLDRKYVGEHSFFPARSVKAEIPTALDQMILSDTDPDYRVFNAAVNTFNDATTSRFHKSVGGYSPIKMRRYQDIIDYHLSRNLNVKVLNMLNTRYFIAPDASGEPVVQRNVAALGNAWFVNGIRWVNSPDEEIMALYDFDPAQEAIIDTVWKNAVGDYVLSAPDSSDRIRLVEYYPNALKYEYTASAQRPVVFSEVYYKTWKAFVDGQEMPLYRVNYILRGLTLPEGSHVVELKCRNPIKAASGPLTNIGSIVNLLLMLLLFAWGIVQEWKKQDLCRKVAADVAVTER